MTVERMRRFRRRGVFAAGIFVCVAPRAAQAADLPGARLQLQRASDAQMCMNETMLTEELASRMTAKGASTEGPLFLDVTIQRAADVFEATVRVEGRKQGVRSLRAPGPACDALHDALVVTLLLLLDEDPSRPPAPSPPVPAPTAPPPPPAASVAPPLTVAPPTSTSAPVPGERPTLWVSLGGALTHGLPEGWFGAVTGDVFARLSRWELGAGGFWGPEKTVDSPPGAVDLSVFGGRVRGCYALAETSSLRWAGCAFGVVGALRGAGQRFTINDSKVRPWFLGGLGTDVEFSLSPRVRLGIVGGALVSAGTESFSIKVVGEVYRTDQVVGWAGAELRWHIW